MDPVRSEPVIENEEFLFLAELHEGEALRRRGEACREAAESGSPAPLTSEELAAACRIAWRNNSRCIGRLHWKSLHVRDRRDVRTAEGISENLVEHVGLAQSDGRIRPVMTVFAPAERGGRAARIWNHQLFGYAGYRSADGEILGDPKNEQFTKLALELGWQAPSERTAFDMLPWIIAGADERPRVMEMPDGLAREVRIRHPHLEWFADLGLQWYAVPVLSDMCFRAAGTDFRAAPFNGWYMGTEIAARNLTDVLRYNMLPRIAERMGLDTSRPSTLWKDRALLELNVAVLHSYEQDGVRMVDHHTASEEFIRFLSMEKAAGREVSARWDWIVPPMSPATTPVFHMSMKETAGSPEFRMQEQAWEGGG
jgi:nitric-oxide synthase